MTTWTLVKCSLRFYWRTHLGVVLGAAVSTAILVGALVVGDSVRHSLKTLALSRLGEVRLALAPQNRYFRAKLAEDLETALNTATAPVLRLRGIAANSDGTARVNRVQVLGVNERFWALGVSRPMFDGGLSNEVFLNERLAAQLAVREGEEILLRVEKPGFLPRDAPLSTDANSSVAMQTPTDAFPMSRDRCGLRQKATDAFGLRRLSVKGIVSDSDLSLRSRTGFGRFSLQANQIAPFNAFVPLVWLQEKVSLLDRANMLLVGDSPKENLTLEIANATLREHWELADADLELRELPETHAHRWLELRTNRVFLDPPVARAAEHAAQNVIGVLTYFVNELRFGNRATPYSIVAAIGNPVETQRGSADDKAKFANLIPSGMNDEEILINTWLAEDLHAKPGDTLELTYFVVGSMRKLEERTSRFRIRAVLPLEGAAADRELMPVFPGSSDAKNCRDWEPGIPIDLEKIRKKDEEYWDLHRGTPKAFVTLKAGQRMWGNRFGNLTALRYPIQEDNDGGLFLRADAQETIEAAIKRELNPASIGLFFQPVREQALAASTQALDFGQLFLGLSFFLIVAALLLMGMLFVFGIEQRAEEVGTLLAVGFPPNRVRRLHLFEGGVLAILGGFLGTCSGVWYTKVVLYALSTVWRSAVGGGAGAHAGAPLHYHAEFLTLIVGAAAGIIVALLAIWVTLRKQAKSPARELLASGSESSLLTPKLGKSNFGFWVALGAVVGTLVVLFLVGKGKDKGAAAAFFISGTLLLVGGLGFSQALLSALARSVGFDGFDRLNPAPQATQPKGKMRMNLAGLGLRNSTRRIGRSLATVGLLACGIFLIIAVSANRHDPHKDAERRSSGTGGFTLFAESSLPVFYDLNSKQGRESYGLHWNVGEGLKPAPTIVSLRVHDGDDASCLNLNRAQTPRLLGIKPEELQARNAFTFVKTAPTEAGHPIGHPVGNPWLLLNSKENENVVYSAKSNARLPDVSGQVRLSGKPVLTVPAIGDEATIIWALGKSVGDSLPYADERGNTFNIRLVGMVANSIFQGGLLISEEEFVARFPSESGYRMFLIDAPSKNAAEVSKTLTRAMQDVGLEITPTAQRLADFNTVQNTYLSIFQLLGGLALLLGSVGLGIVVLRNVMERRNELALLRAVGFEKRSLRWLVLSEHWLLLFLGISCGVVAGLVAVLPALRSPGADVPYVSLALTLFAVVFNGALWTWLATMLALRGPLLAALRNE